MGNKNCCWSQRKEKCKNVIPDGNGIPTRKSTESVFEGVCSAFIQQKQLNVALAYILSGSCRGLKQKMSAVEKLYALGAHTHDCCNFNPDLLAQELQLIEYQSPGQIYLQDALATSFWEELQYLVDNEIVEKNDFQIVVILACEKGAQNVFVVQMKENVHAQCSRRELYLLHHLEPLSDSAEESKKKQAWGGHNCRETVVLSQQRFDALLRLRGELFRQAHDCAQTSVQLISFQKLDTSKSNSESSEYCDSIGESGSQMPPKDKDNDYLEQGNKPRKLTPNNFDTQNFADDESQQSSEILLQLEYLDRCRDEGLLLCKGGDILVRPTISTKFDSQSDGNLFTC